MTKREWHRLEAVRTGLRKLLSIEGPAPHGYALRCGPVPKFNLTWREQDALDAVTLREYRGPRRPFNGSYSGQ